MVQLHDLPTLTPQQVEKTLNLFCPARPNRRTSRTSFECLIGTMLSAQTTGKQVAIATSKLFKLANTPSEMITIGLARVQDVIKNVGLWRTKASNILKTCRRLLDDYAGIVPADMNELQTLPGVGYKTASIVMVFYFGVPAMPVDTHIYRCARRWGLSVAKSATGVSKDLQVMFRKEDWGKIHAQMVTFGRRYCTAKKHDLATCPMCCQLAQ